MATAMHTRQTSHNRSRQGFSLIELLIVIAIILIIAMIAIPKINQQRMLASETAAVKTMQAIHTAMVQYQAQYNKFAASLTELGPPASGAPGPSAADLISKTLSEGKYQGYVYTVQANATGYAITAVPEVFNSTGRRTFYSDQTLVIRQNWGQEPATVNSPEMTK